MRRRVFITLLGSTTMWPLAGRAQQVSGMRRVGVLMGYAENDPEAKVFFAGLGVKQTCRVRSVMSAFDSKLTSHGIRGTVLISQVQC